MILENLEDNIHKLCSRMSSQGIDYCILSNNDPNFSNNPAEHWQTLNWLFDFKDDNGAFLLSKEGKGYFFTDERYRLSMQKKFDGLSIELKLSANAESSALGYLCQIITDKPSSIPVLAMDDKTTRFSSFISTEIQKRPRLIIRSLDFLDSIWHNRPALESGDIFDIEDIVFPDTFERIYTSRKKKLDEIVNMMDEFDDDVALLLTSPNDICYLLNIRCYANKPSMQVPSFLILTKSTGYLFANGVADDKLKRALNLVDSKHIKSIKVFGYDDFFSKAHFLIPHGTNILQISDSSCANISSVFPATDYKHLAVNREAFEVRKDTRSENEIKSICMAFEQDSLAFVRFLYNTKCNAGYFEDEYTAVQRFEQIRVQSPYYISPSFDTIFAYNENGAMPHYAVKKETSKRLEGSGLAVFDFGGQYDFGTTDTTRTLLFGLPNNEYRYYYTAVLKAHIFLLMYEFCDGIEGFRLDAMVRGVLTRYNISVPHGIGHGVSMLGDVHDTAPRLSYTLSPPSLFKIHSGMCFTVEPGVYLDGKFAVRIENTVIAKSAGDGMLVFESLSLVPYSTELIDKSMLDDSEIDFINRYHKKVYDTLSPSLNPGESAFLQQLCRPLTPKMGSY